jgi:hypothetical protein
MTASMRAVPRELRVFTSASLGIRKRGIVRPVTERCGEAKPTPSRVVTGALDASRRDLIVYADERRERR